MSLKNGTDAMINKIYSLRPEISDVGSILIDSYTYGSQFFILHWAFNFSGMALVIQMSRAQNFRTMDIQA